jgi:hypothetical protein
MARSLSAISVVVITGETYCVSRTLSGWRAFPVCGRFDGVTFLPTVRCPRPNPAVGQHGDSRVSPSSSSLRNLPLLDAIARAYRWSNDLLAGRARSIGEIARREHLTARHVRRVMRLAFLAPRIVEAIVEGRQPVDLSTLAMTQRIELPPLWSAQQQALKSR